MKQENLPNAGSPFETEPIGKLMLRFGLPATVSMVVNSIYNLVDQIFIGWGVGYLGNAATNSTFPFVTMYLALNLLIADGGVAFFSLKLGERREREAKQAVGNALTLSIAVSVLYTVLAFALAPTLLLNVFGATEEAFPYALSYGRIILLGVPFVAVSMVLSNIIRADGSPRYSMLCMMAGAVINTVLDALFVLSFDWGVAGAAWATVIGQFVNFLLCVVRIPKFHTFRLEKSDLVLRRTVALRVLTLGISSFFTQLAGTLVVILMNNLLIRCGEASAYGGDIPMAAFGIVMKVNQVMVAVMLGLGVGSQPIVGFNYGAGNLRRVRSTYLRCVGLASVVAFCAWVFFQTCTQGIVNLFGEESTLYNEFALLCFRRFLLATLLYGVTIPTGIFFQAIGKPKRAMLCSMSRQILFFLPLVMLGSTLWGMDGLLYAGPVADTCSFLLVGTLGLREMRRMKRQIPA